MLISSNSCLVVHLAVDGIEEIGESVGKTIDASLELLS